MMYNNPLCHLVRKLMFYRKHVLFIKRVGELVGKPMTTDRKDSAAHLWCS